MKRLLAVVLCLVVACSCLLLTSCKGNAYNSAVKSANTYEIICSYDETCQTISAVQTVQITNNYDNGFDDVKFHIYANCYREDANCSVVPNVYRAQTYPNGTSYGNISFDCVKVNGTAVAYVIEGEDMDILSVPLAKTLLPNDKVTIELTYEVHLANTLHRLGYNDVTVNLGNWYPVLCYVGNNCYSCTPYYNIGDPFVTDVANYHVTLTIPDNYVVASSGTLTEASHNGSCTTYDYEAKGCRDFAIVASTQYKKLSQTVDGTQIDYYYYNDTEAETSLSTAVGAFEYFAKNIGKYPYSTYSVCETGFCYGGMEYPCLSMITSGSNSYQEAIVHETAHQWFYGIIGNDQIANAWMDEGLAEFVTYLYLDQANVTPLHSQIASNVKTYTTYVDVLNRYYEQVDTTLRPSYYYKNDSEYVIFTYVKGSLLFNTLYETMGKTKFWKALSNYYDNACYTVATPSQMIDCFAKTGGNELATVFDAYINGKEIIGKITD